MSPSGIASTIPLSGFSEVADRFDLCLCDVWGVVHNGVAAYRDAVADVVQRIGAGELFQANLARAWSGELSPGRDPFEVFLNVGKAGTEVTAVAEGIGRLVSLILRMPSPLPPSERLRWIID